MWTDATRRLILAALEEDLGPTGDITSALLPDPQRDAVGSLVARGPGVVAGLALAPEICAAYAASSGAHLRFEPVGASARVLCDGDAVSAGQTLATVAGPRVALLAIERTLLNFLGRMSGVATLTHRYVAAARQGDPRAAVYDTRKTIPGWRELDKYAVRCGGGRNHRAGLYDAVLLKDNHLAGIPVSQLADRLRAMLTRLAEHAGGRKPDFVEVEVDRHEQFVAVCEVDGVDVVLLDNYSPNEMRRALAWRDACGRRGIISLEASGGVTLENITAIAATGVDRIAVGALTHSAPALDIAMDF